MLAQPHTGVGRYIGGLLGGLEELQMQDVDVTPFEPKEPGMTSWWVLRNLRRATFQGFDAFHFPFYYAPPAPGCPVTTAIHDVLIFEHPEWFPRDWGAIMRFLVTWGLRKTARVVTASEHVADKIADYGLFRREGISVVTYGVDRRTFHPVGGDEILAARREHDLQRPYVVQFGALDPRRGHDVSIAAMKILRSLYPDLDFVIIGVVRQETSTLTVAPSWVKRLQNIPDSTLCGLLCGASAVIAPSRGEGFDFPLLEALACGAPVVASDIPVHREVFGGSVRFFATGSTEALAGVLESVLTDSQYAQQTKEDGPKFAVTMSWEESARQHLEIWRSL